MKCEINGMVLRAEEGFLKPRNVKTGKRSRDAKNQLI